MHELYDSNIHLVDLESTALPIKLSSHICGKVRAPSPCIAARLVFKTILIADELPFLVIWVLNSIVWMVGLEPTCDQLNFQLLMRERLYIHITYIASFLVQFPSCFFILSLRLILIIFCWRRKICTSEATYVALYLP